MAHVGWVYIRFVSPDVERESMLQLGLSNNNNVYQVKQIYTK